MLVSNCEQQTAPVNGVKTPTSRRRVIFTPSPSSPLSPCRNSIFTSPISNIRPGSMLPSPPRSPPEFLAPKRLFKPIPIGRSGEDVRTARRNLFLKKVQNGREDKAWKARGGEDEIMRMIFVAEHKRWEASLEKAASRIPTIYEEEEVYDDRPEPEYPEYFFALESGAEPPQIQYLEYPSSAEDFDAYLDRDGKELEELLSEMDLDMDHKMSDA
ncbi:hypothetical protein BDD12DRAFT_829765 [Trichophaea hybrida]|nr:hypothetical protein BDD12DRAFT_829765 [Trichophaea hybrida]